MSMPRMQFQRARLHMSTLTNDLLFDLNENAMLDALRYSNKSKFINHERDTPNCTAKAVSVCGVHHITTWALRNIAVGEELAFDYGYKQSVDTNWVKVNLSRKWNVTLRVFSSTATTVTIFRFMEHFPYPSYKAVESLDKGTVSRSINIT
ncbi:hypothetical protein DD237_007861 [Peronospora effusa]|uniref:SET domain-containing protein n=1 Tax=Peronospora effusa TaxID=542832 RepID=A0A3R7W720_9STRA|nr:hypothetical protein DD237_007861 [Peronospora effusa]